MAMKQMVGSPGTWSGIALRVWQFVFAAACFCVICVFYLSDSYDSAGVYVYFIIMRTMMELHIYWSVVLACLDICELRNPNKEDPPRALVILMVVVDGIMAILTFTVASASAVVASTHYVEDVHFCTKVACGQIVLPIVLAFMVSLLEATSALSILVLLASS